MDRFLNLVRSFCAPNVFNPWTDTDPLFDLPDQGPQMRYARLKHHLNTDPALVMIGEAPGFQGCRVAGVCFTSERLIVEGAIPRVSSNGQRISSRPVPFSEPSATIVWSALYRYGLAERTILWNAFAWHPHRPESGQTNRTPRREELDAGKDVLKELERTFSGVTILAVGRTAEGSLAKLGIRTLGCVRHPSMGGAKEFRREMARWSRRLPLADANAMGQSEFLAGFRLNH
jgi:uracil-DNA glycosylase